MTLQIHEEQDWPPHGQVEEDDDVDEEDPVVTFWPNLAEITRRQGMLIITYHFYIKLQNINHAN